MVEFASRTTQAPHFSQQAFAVAPRVRLSKRYSARGQQSPNKLAPPWPCPESYALDSLGVGYPGLFSTCRHYISRRPQFCTTGRPSFSFSPLPDSALIAGQSKTSWQDQTPGPLQLVRITSRTPKNPINRAFLNNFCYTPVPQPALLLPPPAILHILALPPTRAAATPFCPGAALACRLVSYYFILPLHQPWERNHTKPRRECLETTRPSSCLDAVSFSILSLFSLHANLVWSR